MGREARHSQWNNRALRAAAVGVAALLISAGPGSAAAKRGPTHTICERPDSSTLRETRRVRIFAMAEESVELPANKHHAIAGRPIFACSKTTGNSWLLNVPPGSSYALWIGVEEDAFAIHFPRVAYELTDYYDDTHRTWIRVRDLRSGAITRSCPAGAGIAPSRPTHVGSLALNGRGSIAWSAEGVWYDGSSADSIMACDSAGQRALDRGEAIDLESLAMHNSVVSWLDNGARREAWLE